MENNNIEKKSKAGKVVAQVLFYVFVALLIIIYASLRYLRETWPYISYAELLFHLKTSFNGTDPEMIYSALRQYALPAALAIAAFIVVINLVKKKLETLYRVIAIALVVILLLLNAFSIYVYNRDTRLFSDFFRAVFKTDSSDFIESVYVDPKEVSIKFPEQKRNLIYIYLESMEVSFSDEKDGGAFEENYIPNLTKLSKENENFSGNDDKLNGGVALPGTNWTTGALFAQTSGIPLDIPVNEDSISDPEQFFPTIRTMGDILKDEGYTNIVELGTEAGFGGQGAYYIKHGDYEIHDVGYAKSQGYIPEDYKAFWGYEDEKIFEFAKKEITELAKESNPFNYTLFTMDTHCQDGYICRLCDDKYGDNQYANVIACSDRQVSEFIKWIQEQDFYDNTTVVVTGDHPTMDADFLQDVSGDYQRKTYTSIINSAVTPQLDTCREFATIDLFPTILAALGAEMSSDRLGCGTNLYGTQQTILEEYGTDYCKSEFSLGSPFVESLVSIVVTDELMKKAQDDSYIEVADENGNIRFRLIQADAFSCKNITELKLVVHNIATDETREVDMEPEIARSGWYGIWHSDIPFSEVSNLECEVYISVDDFDHYLFKKAAPDELGMWDIKWDFGAYVKQE